MSKINFIGLDPKQAEALVKPLNELLANYQIHYQNLRGFHWNIKGPSFFELHALFEQYYTAAAANIDEIAERILTLGGRPLHTFSAYVETSKIKETKDQSDASKCVEAILTSLNMLLQMERPILEAASELGDEGTVDLITGLVSQQEKDAWMLTSWLNK